MEASLRNCNWQNLILGEVNTSQYLNCSIDRIDIIGEDLIQLFNKLKGEISQVCPLQNNLQTSIQFKEKIVDYDQFYSENKIYLFEDNIKHINNDLQNIESAKNQQFLGNSSTKLIRYTNISCEYKKNLTLLYLTNGKCLLEIQIQLTSKSEWDYAKNKRNTTYEVISDQGFKTRVLIEVTTELIALGQDFILVTHPESRISLYNMKSDQIIFKTKYINQGNIISIAINGDGQYIIGGSDCSLKCYLNDKEQNIFIGHNGVVTQLKFIENKYFLSASQDDHSIRFWSIQNQQSLWLFITLIDITSFAVNQEQKLLFIGSAQGILQWKDFDYQNLIQYEYKYHKAGILCCTTDGQFKKLVSGSKDNVIKLWELNTRRQIGSDMIHGTPLCLVIEDDNLYCGEQQGFIVLWELKNQTVNKIYNNYGDSVTHLQFNFKLYFRSSDSVIKCYFEDKLFFLNQNNSSGLNFQLENYQNSKDLPIFQETIDSSQITKITRIIHSIGLQYYAYGMANGNLVVQHKYGQTIKNTIQKTEYKYRTILTNNIIIQIRIEYIILLQATHYYSNLYNIQFYRIKQRLIRDNNYGYYSKKKVKLYLGHFISNTIRNYRKLKLLNSIIFDTIVQQLFQQYYTKLMYCSINFANAQSNFNGLLYQTTQMNKQIYKTQKLYSKTLNISKLAIIITRFIRVLGPFFKIFQNLFSESQKLLSVPIQIFIIV